MKNSPTLSILIGSTLLLSLTNSLAKAEPPQCSNYLINPNNHQIECFGFNGSTVRTKPSDDVQKNKPYLKASRSLSALNQQIYNYAISKLGQKVGDGECAYLAYEALKLSKAKTLESLGQTGPNADYVWGKLVVSLTPGNRSAAKIMPGDIIQFRNVSTYKKITNPDGSWRAWTTHYPHHTAIVAGVSGSQIKLLHQNVGNNPQTKKTVQQGLLDLDSMQSGTMWVYRPIPL